MGQAEPQDREWPIRLWRNHRDEMRHDCRGDVAAAAKPPKQQEHEHEGHTGISCLLSRRVAPPKPRHKRFHHEELHDARPPANGAVTRTNNEGLRTVTY